MAVYTVQFTPSSHAARFSGAHFIESLVHLRHDMEAIKNMKSLGALLADDLQIGLPHIGTDEDDLRGHFVADHGEESLKGSDRSFFSYPKQARNVELDLINQRQ